MNEPITEQLYNKVVNFVNKMDGSVGNGANLLI